MGYAICFSSCVPKSELFGYECPLCKRPLVDQGILFIHEINIHLFNSIPTLLIYVLVASQCGV